MKVAISSSSSILIDDIYLEESKKLIDYVASNDCELNWGSGSKSIMGACYDGFINHGKVVHGYTTQKYLDDLDNLTGAQHTVYDTTFDLKKNIYNDADIVICLPGGSGSVSEFFAYMEEARSNDNKKDIILYNINNHYEKTIELINDLVQRKFNSESIYDYFKVISSLEEFKEYFESKK